MLCLFQFTLMVFMMTCHVYVPMYCTHSCILHVVSNEPKQTTHSLKKKETQHTRDENNPCQNMVHNVKSTMRPCGLGTTLPTNMTCKGFWLAPSLTCND